MPTGSSSCPRDTPIGAALTELYGDTVLDVDVKPNRGDALSIVGLAREVAAADRRDASLPVVGRRRAGPAGRRPTVGRGPRARAVPAVRRSLGEWRDRRSVAGLGPDAPAGRRHAADQQRRRREQLRHGRARQADPHVRCGRGPRRPDRRPSSRGGGAVRDPRPRRPDPRPGHARHRRRRRSGRDRRDHGRHRVRGDRRDDRHHRRVGHLRSHQHPPLGLPLRPPLGREPAVREGPGVAPGAHRRGPDGAAAHRVGRRDGLAGRGGLGPGGARSGPRRVPAGPHEPAARHDPRYRRPSARSWSASASRPLRSRTARPRSGSRPARSRSR